VGGEPVDIKPTFTYDDLRQMPEDGRRYELLDGEIVSSPAPKLRHQRIVTNVCLFLGRAKAAGHGQLFTAPTDVVFDPRVAALEPDLVFIGRDRSEIMTEDNIQGAPDLVVEVLSESTRRRDIGAKLRTYARYGVRFYWVVDPEEDVVRVYEHAGEGFRPPVFLRADDTLACPLFPEITARVSECLSD